MKIWIIGVRGIRGEKKIKISPTYEPSIKRMQFAIKSIGIKLKF